MTDISHVVCVLDCADADRLADFWAAALGYDRSRSHLPYVALTAPAGGAELLLQQVPERKSGKNRMHLDLRVAALEPTVSRLQDLDATVLSGPRNDSGWLTTVMADPEHNEFCVLVPPAAPSHE